MSADETELTFIRCPGCRSLVPAIATRCRMCGYQFDISQKDTPASGDALRQMGRIRQRTISVSTAEVDAVKENEVETGESRSRVREREEPFRLGVRAAGDAAPPEHRPRVEAPSPEIELPRRVIEPQQKEVETPVDVEPDIEDARQTIRAAAVAPPVFDEPEEEVDLAGDEEVEEGDEAEDAGPMDSHDDEDVGASHGMPQQGQAGEPRAEARRRRRRKRKKKRPRGLEQGTSEPRVEQIDLQAEATEVEPQVKWRETRIEQSASVQPRAEASWHEPRVEPSTVEQPRAEAKWREPRAEQKAPESPPAERDYEQITVEDFEVTVDVDRGDKEMTHAEDFSSNAARGVGGNDVGARPVESRPRASAAPGDGTLLGWLVNYVQDPKGVGSELRSGQFFVGRQRLRNSDMVIADSSISTPHCLVYAHTQEGFRVQDLMSEQGTYIKRRGSENYVAVGGPTEVKHGDWLRFGAYEVMVCLVPFPERR